MSIAIVVVTLASIAGSPGAQTEIRSLDPFKEIAAKKEPPKAIDDDPPGRRPKKATPKKAKQGIDVEPEDRKKKK